MYIGMYGIYYILLDISKMGGVVVKMIEIRIFVKIFWLCLWMGFTWFKVAELLLKISTAPGGGNYSINLIWTAERLSLNAEHFSNPSSLDWESSNLTTGPMCQCSVMRFVLLSVRVIKRSFRTRLVSVVKTCHVSWSSSVKIFAKPAYMIEFTAQKMKFSLNDFSSKCDEIRRKLRIWSHLLEKSIMENFIFWAGLQF